MIPMMLVPMEEKKKDLESNEVYHIYLEYMWREKPAKEGKT